MKQLRAFVIDSFDELKNKVTWPKYGELYNNSWLVLVASLIFALVIGVIDFAFDGMMNWFYQNF